MKPLVSVVVPVYNVAGYLPQCLDSLVSQTLSEIEVILVNDRSTDNSLDILLDYESRHPAKVSVIDSPVNRRQGGAMNLGIRASRAEYVGFVGADDWVDATMLQKLYAKAVTTNSDLVRCFVDMFNEIPGEQGHGKTEIFEPPVGFEGRTLTDADREFLLVHDTVSFQLYRTSLFLDNNLFFPEGMAYEDNYMNKLVLFYVERAALVREHLYHYRIHATSTTNTRNAPWLLDRLRIECMVLDDVAARGLGGRLTAALEYQFMKMYFWNTIRMWELRSDGRFPPAILRDMRAEVLHRIPRFRSNPLYKQHFSLRARLLIATAMISPDAYTLANKLFTLRDRFARHMVRVLGNSPTIYRGVRAIYRSLFRRA